MSSAYLLDTNILSCFLQQGHEAALTECASSVELLTVEEVCDELQRHSNNKTAERVRLWLPESKLRVTTIRIGSEAHTLLCRLHPNLSLSKNLGERACIAVAATQEPRATFVASDKGAMWLALRELHQPGGRLLGLHVFLRRLREDAALPPAVLDAVAAESRLPQPSWWPHWRQSIEQPASAQAG